MTSVAEYKRFLIHDFETGYQRLSNCLTYLDGYEEFRPYERVVGQPSFSRIVSLYDEEITWAADIAMEWWVSVVSTCVERISDRDAALREAYGRFPAGPASRPEVITAVRDTWLEVARVNAKLSQPERLRPECAVLESQHSAAVNVTFIVLTAMPYWPIGIDDNGNWC